MSASAETTGATQAVRYRVAGMNCTDCVAKFEQAARKVPGVEDVGDSLTSQTMTLRPLDGRSPLPEVELAVTRLGDRLDWRGSPWPDLVVAFVIAGLFLHSSWSIVTDSR